VKSVNNSEEWNSIKQLNLYGRLLKICLFTGFLSFPTLSRPQSLESSYLWTPADILTHCAFNWKTELLKHKNLSYTAHKWPNLLFALGRYHRTSLVHMMIESKYAFQNSAIQLYSFGGGYRRLFPFGIFGSYLFLETTFKENALGYAMNLCNLNVGFEGTLPRQYQLTANLYIPLRAYDYHKNDYYISVNQDKATEGSHTIAQPYYLESGNYGFDINIRKTFHLGKRPIVCNAGFYTFYDQYKKIMLAGLLPFERKPHWIIGGAQGFTWQWNDFLSFYYKITFDTAERPLSLSAGIRWQLSTHNPSNPAHQYLWLPPIERHLSPLFYAEKINQSAESKALFNAAWLQKCASIYDKEEFQVIRDISTLYRAHPPKDKDAPQFLYEDLSLNKEVISRYVLFLIHPDQYKPRPRHPVFAPFVKDVEKRPGIFTEIYLPKKDTHGNIVEPGLYARTMQQGLTLLN
jgi:hypothetical protein